MADTSSVPNRVVMGAAEVPRSRILRYFDKASPRAILISSPSGYGKTVLATQVAGLPRFARCAWVECDGHQLDGDVLVAQTVAAVNSVDSVEPQTQCARPADIAAAADSMAALARLLWQEDRPVCVVLDDVCLESVLPEVSELVSLFSRTKADHALILTSREVSEHAVKALHGVLSVDVDDMRLDQNEAAEIVSRVVGKCDLPDLSCTALDLSGGQAALVSVLVRHAAMRGGAIRGSEHSLDLTALLVRLAETQLDSPQAEVLFVLAVLGHATPAELASVDSTYRSVDLVGLSRCVPLIRFTSGDTAVVETVRMHDLAQDVFSSPGYLERFEHERLDEIYSACVRVLEQRRDYRRLIPLLVVLLTQEEVGEWLLLHGERVALCGQGLELRRALEVLPPALLLSHSRLLLMSAEYGSVASDASERMARASAARDLAECDGDDAVMADALLVKASAAKDLGRVREACKTLGELMALPEGAISRERRLLTASHLVTQHALFFDREKSEFLRRRLEIELESATLPDAVVAHILTQLAATSYAVGRTQQAARLFSRAARFDEVPVALRAMNLGNYAFVLAELGHCSHAVEILDQHALIADGYGLETYRVAGEAVRAELAFIVGPERVALEAIERSLYGYRSARDKLTEAHGRLKRAGLLRSIGDLGGAMADVEVALEYAANHEIAYHRYLAEAELAANFLALGDLDAAARHAQRVRKACVPKDALHQILRAEMVLAEVGRRQGRIEEAVDRLRVHEEYVLEDNMNYVIAIYIRTFPALLGLFAAAFGAQRLPGYLLRMITGHHAEDTLLASRETLSENEWRVLASRLVGEEGSERLDLLATFPFCRVRLFGGLEVTVGDHGVPEADWCKRKSRLLFAMLVLQQGRDLSRECIYEYLWPEMTEARARNNLYVTWSAMKAALMPDAERSVPCPYASHKGGVCRISTSLVSSDVARFDTLFADARSAEAAGDAPGALRAYEGLVDIYRGELLPGDIYDDWFASARDRYRQDFGDGMLAAYHLLSVQGDHAPALRMVRRGIAADSWREDLYQAALKSQIALGQRGAAVETYMACRSCLAEDLGLDPSSETVRLYEQILAMEDGPDPDPAP